MSEYRVADLCRLIDKALQEECRLKYDADLSEGTGIELLYSDKQTGDQYRITFEKQSSDHDGRKLTALKRIAGDPLQRV